jgi:predicted RNA-binding Zn-ribbon protein involved in translation (DUF1610 family)
MADPDDIVVKCPTCGNTDIRERNEAFAYLRVRRWERDETWGLVPADIDTDESAEWETARNGAPFTCLECEWEGWSDDLIAEPRTPTGAHPDA